MSRARRRSRQPRRTRRPRSALRRESDRGLLLQIRRNLALPMEQRTNFLRKRLARGATAL